MLTPFLSAGLFLILQSSKLSNFTFMHWCLLDGSVREYMLEGYTGLRQLASIPIEGKPDPAEILFENERGFLMLADEYGKAVRACRQEQADSRWKVSRVARDEPKSIWIFSWCFIGTNRIALWDYESKDILLYEYEWLSTTTSTFKARVL